MSITREDWNELVLAPLWVLGAVGGADGKVDKRERAALQEGVRRCAAHSDEFVREVLSGVSRDFDAIWERYMADERFAVHALKTVGEVLSRATTPTQALHFKQTLVQMGLDVADASGGRLGVGAARGRAERKALNDIAAALRLPSRRLIAASLTGFNSVLVALDGSPESEAALSVARAIADRFESKVTLLQVVSRDSPVIPVAADGLVAVPPAITPAELRASAEMYLNGVRSTYGAPEWQALVVEGAPADVIARQAKASAATLIVMATSGSAGFKRLFEGNVTEDVVRRADVPVLIVPVAGDEF